MPLLPLACSIDSDAFASEDEAAKAASRGDVLVHGSRSLVHWLAREGQIDEYRLLMFPVLLGKGLRLFDGRDSTPLELIETRSFNSGVVLLRYQLRR